MKAEINNENKARFFALYWGRKVMYVGGVGLVIIGKVGWNIEHPDFFLELKTLSSISDDVLNVLNLKKSDYSDYAEHQCFTCYETDLLRSRGYALPWMGLSVDEMVQAGWIKLTDS